MSKTTTDKAPSAGALHAANRIVGRYPVVGRASGIRLARDCIAAMIDTETRCAELEAALRDIHKCVTSLTRYYGGNLDPIWTWILNKIPDLEPK